MYTDSGTISSDGQLHIVENGVVTLTGLIVGPGHISGSWVHNSASGTWDLTLVPTIAGAYSGSWTQSGFLGTSPMKLQINQVGGVLSGTTTETTSSYSDTGTITASGSVHIVETYNTIVVDLYGSVVSPHHLTGTWGASGTSGNWDVA
jgi:hypothetical protein